MSRKIVIGSRESKLAVIQTEMVKKYIESNCPQMQVEVLTMKTTGDVILDRTLDQVGGKGLFVKELDKALMDRRSDLSVHSLKDMPMEVPEELPLVAFSRREDPRDVLVLPQGMSELNFDKPIGCSSKRRILQLQELYPQATFATVRGNVLTRLRKLDEGNFSALILAAAGLKRLGLEERISRFLDTYNDADARDCALCERAFVRILDGGCSSPVAAHARIKEDQILLLGLYYDEMDGGYLKGSLSGHRDQAEALGEQLALQLKAEYGRRNSK